MSIPLSSTMTVFSFTKVESWRNVNFFPKMHQIAPNCVSNFKNFPEVITPDTRPCGGGPPPQTPPPLGASRLDWPLATRWSPLRVSYFTPEKMAG